MNIRIWLQGHVTLVSVAFDEAAYHDWRILQRKQILGITSWYPESKRNKRRKFQYLCQGVKIPTFVSRYCFSEQHFPQAKCSGNQFVHLFYQLETRFEFISFWGNTQDPNNIIVRVLTFNNDIYYLLNPHS